MNRFKSIWIGTSFTLSLVLGCAHSSISDPGNETTTRLADWLCHAMNSSHGIDRTTDFPRPIEAFLNSNYSPSYFKREQGIAPPDWRDLSIAEKSFVLYQARNSEDKTLFYCAIEASYGGSALATFFRSDVSEPYKKSKTGYSPYTYAQANRRVAAVNFIEENSPRKANPGVLDKYCHNGKQIKGLKARLRAVIANPRTGIPLDKYQELLGMRRARARELAREIFYAEAEISQARRDYVGDNALASGEESDKDFETVYAPGAIRFFEKSKEVQPNVNDVSSLGDFRDLLDGYAFNIPKSVQGELFQTKKVTDRYPALECLESDGYLSLNESCRFSPSKALTDRPRSWMALAYKFVSVKEAPGRYPQEILFEVDFNLQAVCQYAVSVDGLKASGGSDL